jgi:hypothetical protein
MRQHDNDKVDELATKERNDDGKEYDEKASNEFTVAVTK